MPKSHCRASLAWPVSSAQQFKLLILAVGDEVAQRISQSGYDITPLTIEKKQELAGLLTDHQR